MNDLSSKIQSLFLLLCAASLLLVGCGGSNSAPPVQPVTPTIAWPTPAQVTIGTTLSSAQLNATATYNGSAVAGTFAYTPSAGTVMSTAGTQTLSVKFTPADSASYNLATASVSLTLNRAMPVITWATPAPVPYGTGLSS